MVRLLCRFYRFFFNRMETVCVGSSGLMRFLTGLLRSEVMGFGSGSRVGIGFFRASFRSGFRPRGHRKRRRRRRLERKQLVERNINGGRR